MYFVTQNPLDVPETVLAQLGNRVQHALRAYTPRETNAVKTAADTFRPNPDFKTFEAITNLATGEALISTLQAKGVPSMVQRTLIRPPSSRIGPLTPDERAKIIAASPVSGQYDQTVDRDSAFEMLARKAEAAAAAQQKTKEEESGEGGSILGDLLGTALGTGRRSGRQTVAETAMKSVVRSVSNSLGRALVRGILGSFKR